MPTLLSQGDLQVHPKGPNFLVVVLLASVALAVMLVLAYIILVGVGEVLLPSTHSAVQPAVHRALSALALFTA